MHDTETVQADYILKIHDLQLKQEEGSSVSQSAVTLVDKRAVKRIQTELCIKCGCAEATNRARSEAVNSIKNAVPFGACMLVSKMLINDNAASDSKSVNINLKKKKIYKYILLLVVLLNAAAIFLYQLNSNCTSCLPAII